MNSFCAALAVLKSTSQVPKTTAFITVDLTQTSSIFLSTDCSMKSSMEISSKLYALKEKKLEFEHTLLSKDSNTQRLSELENEYDAQKEYIRVLTVEMEKEKIKLASLVEYEAL